ncbi:MAG: hypothetical protein ABIS92_15275 [Polyangia bacterium]
MKEAATDAAVPELAITDEDEVLLALLARIQTAMLMHPEAGVALFRGLAEEGRLFAQTAGGRRWRDRLCRSELLERALLVWQNVSLWMTEDTSDSAAVPSGLVDAVATVAASSSRDVLLERLFRAMDVGS